jgi:hypothetical protein
MEYVVDHVINNAPIMAHSKYYAGVNDYLDHFNFLVAENKKIAIPQDERFWKAIFANATKWGVKVFEIDWLESLYEV